MYIPAPALLISFGLMLLLAVIASVLPALMPLWAIALSLLVLCAATDAWRLHRRAGPALHRQLPQALPLGVDREITLRLENETEHVQELAVYDHPPSSMAIHDLPQRVLIGPSEGTKISYRVHPLVRGSYQFGLTELLLRSPWKLWDRRLRVGDKETVRVYPNFAALTRFALLATDHRLSQIGVLKRRRRGQGMDFHQLREYREGDIQRQIDWKATSRMGKLISREYQDERDQQIILLVDCGRRMQARDDALSHMDHVLNAALLLAYVALRQGDAVGLATFGGERRFIAPRKSMGTVQTLMSASYDLQPTLHSPDYLLAARDLITRQRKRSLVVILSNLRDEDDDTLLPALQLLKSRHLVMLASLREGILSQSLRAPVRALEDALTHAATAEYLERRRDNFSRLSGHGISCVDVEPAELPLALVNRYIDVKRAGRL